MDRLILLAALAVAVLPGAALAAALRVRSVLLAAAVAPAATIGVLLVVSMACAVTGLPFGAVPAAAVVLLLLVIALPGVVRRSAGRAGSPVRRLARPGVPEVSGGLLVLGGAAIAVRAWLRGFGGLDRIPQEHDMVTHQLVVAYMTRTGRAAPWEIVPVDLLTGNPVTFYPAGSHLAPALLAGLGPGPVAALNAFVVVYLAVCWTGGVAALSGVAARHLRLGRRTAWLVAGTAAVLAAALYRPGFELMHDGGIYPNAVTLSLTPGLVAGFLLAARVRSAGAAVLLGVASAGMVAAHPSAVLTVGLTLAVWLLGDLLRADGRARARRLFPVLCGAAVVAALVALPLLLDGGAAAGGVGARAPDSSARPLPTALTAVLGLTYGGYLDPAWRARLIVPAVLCLAGALLVLLRRRGAGPVAAWAFWAIVTTASMASPGRGAEAPVTGFFYHALVRVWAHVELLVPTLGALAVVLVAAGVVRTARRRLPRPAGAMPVLSALVLVVTGLLAALPVRLGAATNQRSVAERYSAPAILRVGTDDLAAVDYLRGRVAPGVRVLNSANDGSTALYVDDGIPVVNTATLGSAAEPDTVLLLRAFRDYPRDPAVRAALHRLDVGWVYVDEQAPRIGAGGAPYGWVSPARPYTTAPGLTGLDGLDLPGLTPEFRHGSVTVYRLDLDRVGAG